MTLYRMKTTRYLSKYGHPNGWVIVQDERDYSLRGFPRGAIGATERTSPKRWWEVHRAHSRPRRVVEWFATLRDAREWCDAHTASPTTRTAPSSAQGLRGRPQKGA